MSFPYQRELREQAAELKFLLSVPQAQAIRSWARHRLAADPHASGPDRDGYRISSLYMDTESFDVAHRRGSFRLSKFRIRRYGDSPRVFLERKLRTQEMLCKRRTLVDLNDLPRLRAAVPDSSWSGAWFHRRVLARGMRPSCQISYRRTARVGMNPYGPFRLTLDEGLSARPARGLWFDEEPESVELAPEQVILELKFREEVPLVFKELIREFELNPRRISKYRMAVTGLGLVESAAESAVSRGLATQPALAAAPARAANIFQREVWPAFLR
jgi:hypothetical protein